MKKRITSFVLALILTLGLLPTITPVVSAASITTDDMASLASAAQQAIGSSVTDLGLPAGDWCGYFVGNRMNNSQIAAKLGTTSYNVCAYAISLVSWICATKDAGVFYVASPVHQNRLLEIDPRLGNNGRMVARTSNGWSPLPGDILQFSWSDWNLHTFDHTGIVVSVSGNMITYVDGNSSTGRVAAHTISKDSSTIIGHIRFNMDNIPQSTLPAPAPSVSTVSSIEQGDWGVWIPANHYLPLDANADSTSHISSVYARPASYRIHCSQRATLTDGTVRYQGVLNVPGSGDANFWFTYASTMTVEDYTQPAHTEHTWNAGVETASPTLTTSGTRTYTCTVCGETKTESIPVKTSVSGRCYSDGDVRWTLTNDGTVTISGTGTLNQLSADLGEYISKAKHVVVEEGITKVKLSFIDCKSIQTIRLPASVSDVQVSAFLGCTALTSVTIDPQNPWFTSADGAIFSKNMDTIIRYPAGRSGSYCIPDGVKTIASAAFGGTKLTTVEIPVSVTEIAEYSFEQGPTMLVHSGSYAEQFAQVHGRTYKVINAPTEPTPNRVKVTLYIGTLKTNNLDRFKTVKTYQYGMFCDVSSDSWYAQNVVTAYELGLMKGIGDGVFQPGNNVTIAEAITLAARLRSVYYADGETFDGYDGGNWYDPYVNYARRNGLLTENYDFSRPATREEFVHILAQALPSEALSPILTSTPSFDDAGSIVYQSDVDVLSQAGIITGNGSCFLPKDPITRAEVAAVVTRMAKAELRKG